MGNDSGGLGWTGVCSTGGGGGKIAADFVDESRIMTLRINNEEQRGSSTEVLLLGSP